MKLSRIARALESAGQLVDAPRVAPDITGVTEDSRRVTAGMLFCAVRGSAADGHRFIPAALKQGAAALIVSDRQALPANGAVPTILVRDGRIAVAVAAAEWYGRPADDLTVVGVTGTNGKSTTVALIRHLIGESGDTGSIGTVGAFDGAGNELPEGAGLTTPGAVELQATFAELKRRGCRKVVMEASSHALDQRRLSGVGLAAGVYTNLTHDHLDYHGDLSAYFAAKALLSSLIEDRGIEAVNLDDRAWNGLEKADRLRRITFGLAAGAQVRASDLRMDAAGSAGTLWLDGQPHRFALPLIGDFNVSNALAATAVASGLGVNAAEITSRLARAPQVPGRVERIVAEPFVVLRDYAHTPDALERVIKAVKPLTKGRLIVLFGAGGDRDRKKRPVMGQIAARNADLPIVTSDNPRTEDPGRIIDDIEEGMEGVAHIRMVDRRDAIRRALTLAKPGDCILLAGKGHETYQVIGTQKFPFDEVEIVRAELDQLGAGAA
jgi:UDP-N-acetylmuramoyl-L-alanyl-D-glutamate--2,6-diaminopimelate ligase